MPTDISTPVWRCDICRTTFGGDRAAAERCESAGPPGYLPDGELCLHYADRGSRSGYRLVTLHPVAAIGTLATTYNDSAGHVARYEAEGTLKEGRNLIWEGTSLWPAKPGRLSTHLLSQVSGLADRGFHPHTGAQASIRSWAFTRAGLPVSEERVGDVARGIADPFLARPITPPVRDALAMLGAFPRQPRGWDYYGLRDGQGVIAAEETGRRDGLPEGIYDPARLACWLTHETPTDLRAEIQARQTAWRQGAPVSVPMPRLEASRARRLSASKLTKAQLAVIATTGVPWPPRTSADEYANLLIQQTLGVRMTPTTQEPGSPQLFSTVQYRIAVTSSKGGVGKSTVTAALGASLAAVGRQVLIVDMNLVNPGQHIIWGLGPAEVDTTAKLIRGQQVPCACARGGSLRVFSHGQLAADTAGAVISVDRAGEWLTFLAGALDLRGVDVIIFDMGPGWDDVHRHVFDKYQIALTGVVHVTTGHRLAVDTELVHGDGMPQRDMTPRWLIENLSRVRGPVIGAPGVVAEIRLHGTTEQPVLDLAARLRMTYAGSLPWEPDPITLGAADELASLAHRVLDTTGPQQANSPEEDR